MSCVFGRSHPKDDAQFGDSASKESHMWDQVLARLSTMAQKMAKQLGDFLRKKRGDLTYAQFARKMGVSDSSLQRLEMGEQNVTLGTLEQIRKRLKCKVSDIFPD